MSHIVKSYDAEFSELDRMTAQIGGLAEKRLADACQALERRDPKLADAAVGRDRAIDDLERQVQERAILMIAKRALAVAGENHPKPLMAGLGHMTDLAMRQLKVVLDALSYRDADKALAVWRSDASLDALYNSVFRELLTYMMEDPRNIGLCTHLLFGAKNIERIGDHTTNIAENVVFLVTGKALTDDRPKSDDTSSVVPERPMPGVGT
jgi:phosphate transport system protein